MTGESPAHSARRHHIRVRAGARSVPVGRDVGGPPRCRATAAASPSMRPAVACVWPWRPSAAERRPGGRCIRPDVAAVRPQPSAGRADRSTRWFTDRCASLPIAAVIVPAGCRSQSAESGSAESESASRPPATGTASAAPVSTGAAPRRCSRRPRDIPLHFARWGPLSVPSSRGHPMRTPADEHKKNGLAVVSSRRRAGSSTGTSVRRTKRLAWGLTPDGTLPRDTSPTGSSDSAASDLMRRRDGTEVECHRRGTRSGGHDHGRARLPAESVRL